MKTEKMDRLMRTLMGISALAVFAGALLKLWHYPVGGSILWVGMMSYAILSSMEIRRLHKIIAQSKRVVNPDDLGELGANT